MKLLIQNATIFDPHNGKEGETGDLYIRDGRLSRPFKTPDRKLDATGLWALPGGIEAGAAFTVYGLSLYAYQKGLPTRAEDISATYARMGYTHLHESMMFPTTALETHRFLASLPYQDGSASLCLTLREFGALIGADTPPHWTVRFLDLCAHRFRALALRLPETHVHFRESTLSRFNIPAKRVLTYLASLPLNLPVLIETSSRLLDEELPGGPCLCYSHIGRAIDGTYAYKQVTTHIVERGISGDLGLLPPVAHHQLRLELGSSRDERLTAYLGFHFPLKYLEVSPPASQLSLLLSLATHASFKRNLAFSTLCLGPQAGTCYPVLFRQLFEHDPSYTVADFVVQTRVRPAADLGLSDRGHLGAGAIGDVALYDPRSAASPGEVLSRCHTLIKGGTLVIENGTFTGSPTRPDTKTVFRSHSPTERDLTLFAHYFKAYPRLEHLQIPDSMGNWEPLPA